MGESGGLPDTPPRWSPPHLPPTPPQGGVVGLTGKQPRQVLHMGNWKAFLGRHRGVAGVGGQGVRQNGDLHMEELAG
jgi:hypothetical protein